MEFSRPRWGGFPVFFDFFGTVGLLGTIVENDLKIFNKVVGGMKNICKKGRKNNSFEMDV